MLHGRVSRLTQYLVEKQQSLKDNLIQNSGAARDASPFGTRRRAGIRHLPKNPLAESQIACVHCDELLVLPAGSADDHRQLQEELTKALTFCKQGRVVLVIMAVTSNGAGNPSVGKNAPPISAALKTGFS